MAAGLNVIPIGAINNIYCQAIVQALRNLQTGRHAFKAATAILSRAVDGSGGSNADLGALLGISEGQADIVHDELLSLLGQLEAPSLVAAWDQANAFMGIVV